MQFVRQYRCGAGTNCPHRGMVAVYNAGSGPQGERYEFEVWHDDDDGTNVFRTRQKTTMPNGAVSTTEEQILQPINPAMY